jgi:hypothetical protein
MLRKRISPGDSLFIYPYFPTAYFLTGGVNPTRYSWIFPAQMTSRDEASVRQDLIERPPRWVLYENIPVELYLKHWPSADPGKLRMDSLERFFQSNYRLVENNSHRLAEFHLLERNGG